MKTTRAQRALRLAAAIGATAPHTDAYKLDHNSQHTAEAWLEFRKHKIRPPETVLQWIDQLAADVLHPAATRVRPKENTVRDLELWREVARLQARPEFSTKTAAYAEAGRQYGLSAGHVKTIVARIEAALDDPNNAGPRAYHKR